MSELRRLILRDHHVAPMVSALLAGTDAAVTIRDAHGATILERAGAGSGEGHHEVSVDGETLGWVEGGRMARGVAAVLAYAAAREHEKRSLAGRHSDVTSIAETAVNELSRLPNDARGFLLLLGSDGMLHPPAGIDLIGSAISGGRSGEGIVGAVVASGSAEVVEDPSADPRATGAEIEAGALVAVALRAEDRTIGVLGATGTGGSFRAADLKVVTAIAALAGPAIGRSLGGAG